MKWEPIETAPKDGSEILLFFTTHFSKICVGHYAIGNWIESQGWSIADKPTHWMPLPEPPV